jgi:hypothetical protein
MVVMSGPNRSPLLLTRIAAFVAVGVVSGLALSTIPNVELVTAICFAAGYLLGLPAGLVSGALIECVFAGFHPMGSSMGFLLLAQMLGMASAGAIGAMTRPLSAETGISYRFLLAGAAVVATMWFDLLTNLAYPVSIGFAGLDLRVYFAAAVPFAAIHLAANVVVFVLLVAPLLPRLRKALSW